MKIEECCVTCLMNRQKELTDDPVYLKTVKEMLNNRPENMAAPVMVYHFNQFYEQYFGKKNESMKREKKQYNDLVLSMVEDIKHIIETSGNPLLTAFRFARTGNYIDFGALREVEEEKFLTLLEEQQLTQEDLQTWQSFIDQCKTAKTFLYIHDNCGEVVLDKLFIHELHISFPQMTIYSLVRGDEALNDVTPADAAYVHLEEEAIVISNGLPLSGTDYSLLPADVKSIFDSADIILSKGQGNYETLAGRGHHIFYAFLCKCQVFLYHFKVPKFTGLFIEEK